MSLFLRATRYKLGCQNKAVDRISEVLLSFDDPHLEDCVLCLRTVYYSNSDYRLSTNTISKGFMRRSPWPSDVFVNELDFQKAT